MRIHADRHGIAFLHRCLVSREGDHAAHFVLRIAHAAVQTGSDEHQVIGIDDAVAAEVCFLDLIPQALVVLIHAHVILQERQIIVVQDAVAIAVCLREAVCAIHLIDADLIAAVEALIM